MDALSDSGQAPKAGRPQHLGPGVVLAGRYQITSAAQRSPFGEVFRALDPKYNLPVAVRTIRPAYLGGNALDRLKTELERVSAVEHKNLVKPLGVLNQDGVMALVTRWVEGQTLRALIASKNGEPVFSLKGAYNVVAHLCNALTHARDKTWHGAITPSNVLINKAGRVKLAELGLPRALPGALANLEPVDRPCLAPEILKAPAGADGRADLWSLGAILFELVTGKMFMPGMLPRKIISTLPSDLDPLIACIMSAKREDRLTEPAALKAALQKILDKAPPASTSGQMSTSGIRQAAASRPSGPQRVQVQDDEPRWLVTKGKLDFGPYTLTQLRAQIDADQVVPGNILIDQELGTRAPIEEHPLIREIVLTAAQRRDDARRVQVETSAVQQETRKGVALYGFIGIGAAVLIVGAILAFKLIGGSKKTEENDVSTLAGSDLKGLHIAEAKHVDDRDAQRRHRQNRGNSAPRPGGKDTWDDSLSFDMAGADVGDERLDDSQINGVISRNSGGLGRCLSQEVGRGGTHTADIEFVVLGSGKVSAVRVNGQTSTSLAGCIRGAMQSMGFPPFNGPRTRAQFSMSL